MSCAMGSFSCEAGTRASIMSEKDERDRRERALGRLHGDCLALTLISRVTLATRFFFVVMRCSILFDYLLGSTRDFYVM